MCFPIGTASSCKKIREWVWMICYLKLVWNTKSIKDKTKKFIEEKVISHHHESILYIHQSQNRGQCPASTPWNSQNVKLKIHLALHSQFLTLWRRLCLIQHKDGFNIGSLCVVVTLWFGCGGVVSVCRLRHYWSLSQPAYRYHTTPAKLQRNNNTSNQSNTTHEITQ